MDSELSVIIPVFNGEKYINQAIDSVLKQDGVKTEIIIVNDGSTDNTLSRLNQYKDDISIYTIVHSGASAARNYGLKKATSKYIMFLDADDFLLDNRICQECIERIKKENLEMVLFSFQYLNNLNGKFNDAQIYNEELEGITDASKFFHLMIKTGVFPASPCFKVIKRELLISHDLFFKGEMIAEDVEWFVRVMIATKHLGLINKPAYIYRKFVPGSVTFSMNIEKCKQFYLMIKEALKSIDTTEDLCKQQALYGSMAYEYCILIGNTFNVQGGKSLGNELKSLSYILKYDLFPRITYAKWLYRILGYKMTSCLFGLYIRHLSKSKQ